MKSCVETVKSEIERGHNFAACAKDGYVYERVWGNFTVSEAELNTEVMMRLGNSTQCRNLAVDIQELDWINNLSLRRRGIELFYTGAQVYDHIALISRRPAIIYLIEVMVRAAGLDVRSFADEQSAAEWLRSHHS